jgi:hypothetical protein
MSDCSGNVICNGNAVEECGATMCCKQIEKIKLYSQEECASIDGIWHANGECTKKTGGSYSWDNRTTVQKPAVHKLGKPSPDGRIQLYTKDECDLLGGNWYENGECLKKTGGSFSWDNRPNTPKPVGYNVQVSLQDSSHEYKTAKSVTVSDASGNVLFSTEPVAKKLNGVSLAGGLKDK